jgi:hypothetical protein
MMQKSWDAPAFDDDDQTWPGYPTATLVSLHFILSALRRRWLVCVMSAVLGLLLAVAYLTAFPLPHRAKAALVLAHQEGVDPTLGMSTDIGLLMTQTVAAKTIASLQLSMTPDDFLRTVEAERVSPEVLALTLSAPTEAEAVRRLTALTSVYLDFRAEQLTLQSNVLVDGMRQRIEKLQGEVAALTRRIELLSASVSPSTSNVRQVREREAQLNDTITQRAYIQSRIEALQVSVEDVSLRSASVVSSSRVVDPAAADVVGARRRTALVLASGLIGGTALGCGMVLFVAITSDRLRRRSDVAAALGVAVPVSVGRIAPLRKGWLWLPPLRALNRHRADERQRLAHAIEKELLLPQRRGRLAVAGIDNADEVGFAVAAAAAGLAARGYSVTIIDLTEHLSRGLRFAPSTPGSSDAPTVLRPRGLPALAHGAADLLAVGRWDEGDNTPLPQLTDLTLVVADLDPAVGADHLTAWTDSVIVVVTAGRSSAEKVSTVGDQVRTAGLDLRFAALLHTEATDDSSGEAGLDRPESAQLPAERDQPRATARSEAR